MLAFESTALGGDDIDRIACFREPVIGVKEFKILVFIRRDDDDLLISGIGATVRESFLLSFMLRILMPLSFISVTF
jgi:hypothetical protein